MLIRLKPLIVVSGTLHVEGGLTSSRRVATPDEANGKRGSGKGVRTTIVQDRDVSDDRRRAHVIFATYARRIKTLRLLKTNFGTLVDPARIADVQSLFVDMTKLAADFNKTSAVCKIENCLVWEELTGNRKAAVEGWIARHKQDGDAEVVSALPLLQAA